MVQKLPTVTNRKQRVVINGEHSEYEYVEAGVPQGSILGPLLFLIYINDLPDDLNCPVKIYADDTVIYVSFSDINNATTILNNNLQKLSDWGKQWLVEFSPSKTESMLLGRNNFLQNQIPDLTFDNRAIENVTSHTHLGLKFTADLSWRSHIEEKCAVASKRLDVLKGLF